jgi:RecB family exonuclease
VAATGTVEVWEAAGEHAQPELTARELTRLAHQACGAAAQAPHEAPFRLVVAAPEPLTWFEALAPKLTARGMAVSVNAKVPLLGTRTGFAMSELLESVSELLAAAAAFEAEKNREVAGAASDGATSEGAAGAGALAAAAQAAPLPPMDWWPPTKLVDALTALPCGIGLGTIRELDATWQANRVLTPKAVLQDVHRACRQAGAEGFDAVLFALEKGRLTEAAQRLLELAPLTPAAREARAALAAWVELAQALAMLGERGTRENFASNVQLLCEAAANVQVPARERRVSAGDAPHLACEVEVVAPQALTNQPPASAYAVVLCNMTRDAWSIKTDKHATTALLELMHLVRQEDVLARARYELWRGERVATHALALERPRLDLDHKKAFPSVLFDEVLACYQPVSGVAAGTAAAPAAARKPRGQAPAGAQPQALPFPPVYTLDERDVPALEAPSGTAAAQELTFLQPPEGTLAPELQRLVVPPRNGELAGESWQPTLSASQLERYLECPYKWYVSSRLQLATLAAEFDAKSKGTFAHAVLERLYRTLYQEALAAAGLEELPTISMPLPGSAVRPGNVDHAIDLLHQAFWAQVAQERTSKSAKLVRYVPHTPLEEASLAQLEATLARSLEYVAPRFEGFEPRAFELKFGGREGVIATYAGVRIVGTIDRLDVDAAGNALVIDYKTKGNLSAYNQLMNEATGAFAPRHIQSLLYAQMVGRTLPGVTPVGALYLGLEKGGSLAGAAAPGAAERVLGYSQGTQRKAQENEIERLDTAQSCGMRFSEVLDATEDYVAAGVARLLAGDITPAPCDEAACQYCPATTCKARLA